MQVARVYLRVSTQGQDLDRQESIITDAREAGYYIAGVYREKASGARADRPELLRLIADLQPGEVVVAEKIDRISRLPLPEAEKLIETIREKGARLAVPGVVDLSDIAASADGVAKIVLESIQGMLLKLALQMARDDFEDRRERQRQGIELAKAWNAGDVGALVGLLHKDIVLTMPPWRRTFTGRDEVERFMTGVWPRYEGFRAVAIVANGQPAAAVYTRRDDGPYLPHSLHVLAGSGEIAEVVLYAPPLGATLIAAFGLPSTGSRITPRHDAALIQV